MSPRPYNLGQRQAQVDQGRRRVLDAARAVLGEATGYTGFTLDAVAKRADVARATLYYQFNSKTGLLEAVCDDLAEAGGMSDMGAVFTEADPYRALDRFVDTFARFWEADRPAMRRLRALAALDPDVGAVIAARNERAQQGLRVLVDRLPPQPRAGKQQTKPEELVRILGTLLSFETFDSLAGADRTPTQVAPIVTALVGSALARRS